MKIVLKEEQQEKLKLPPFIYKAIVNKSTSIGDNEALPPFGDFGIEYAITRKGYEEADEIINKYISDGKLESKDVEYLTGVLGNKIERCKKLETTLKPQLEKLCENIVNSAFSIPSDTINLKCELVGKVKPKNDIRVLPEGDEDGNTYDFEDIDEVELTNKVILKRRFINSLIQGLSYWLSTDLDDWHDTVAEMNREIWNLWYEIKHISDYLLYTKKDEINDKHPNLLSYVEVRLGKNGKKTEIYSQGIIFPYLLRDTFRGLLELFSAHSLPKNSRKALYIIKKADFLVAEPWDLRLGNGFVEMLHDSLTKKYQTDLLFKPSKIPFFFKQLCQLKIDEFNSVMKNFLLGTRKGEIIAKQMDAEITHNIDYQKFKDRIQQKNIKTSVINDGDFSKEELDGYVLQENEVDEMMAYHGSGSDFDKFNHKKYLGKGAGTQVFGWGTYITNDIEIAKSYAENIGNGNCVVDYDKWLKQGLTFDEITKWPTEKKYLEEFINNHIDDFKKANINEFDISYVVEIIWGILKNENFDKDFAINSLKTRIKNKIYEYDGYGRKLPDETCENKFRQYTGALRALEIMKTSNNKIVYEVEIPDDDGFNYLSWHDYLTDEQVDTIYSGMRALEKKYGVSLFDDIYNSDLLVDGTDGETLYCGLSSCFYKHLESTNSNSKSSKAVSLFLMQCGFDGIKYEAGTVWGKPYDASEYAYNYVIFDANKVKIVNKTRV
jgi:hypothetical protein